MWLRERRLLRAAGPFSRPEARREEGFQPSPSSPLGQAGGGGGGGGGGEVVVCVEVEEIIFDERW